MDAPLRFGSPAARIVLAATILASGMGFLDSTVVTVALPRIAADLGGGVATVQWVLDGYLLTLGSLVLIGGALGDLLGLRRVFLWGIVAFGITSALCAAAPTAAALVAARTLQGAAAALMVPASLAILSRTFAEEDRGRAIGLWSGLSGITTAVGPVVGGFLVDVHPSGWRAIFLINLPVAAVSAYLALKGVPDVPGSRTRQPLRTQVDLLGGLLVVAGLALIVGSLIEGPRLGWGRSLLLGALGTAALIAFLALERRRERTAAPPPMMPPAMFAIRSFSVANVQTFVVYAGLTAVLLVLTVGLQIGLGWSALAAGAAGIPITLVLAAGSGAAGSLLPRVGSRALLTIGPAVMVFGIVVLATLRPGSDYWVPVLPGLLAFALGLTLVVAPITATALGDIPAARAGTGSGINNAVARIGGLLAVAAVPLAAGLRPDLPAEELFDAYRAAMLLCAGLCGAGAVIAWFGYPPGTGRVHDGGRRTEGIVEA